MPRLLQLNVTANWGSTGRIAEGIGQAAMARGWESAIAYGREMNPSQSQLVKVGNRFDVYAHYAQHRLFDREGLGSKRPTKRLIKWIDSYKPDIIHLHNIHDHWLNYPLLFQYLATIETSVVWTFHDCWAFTGGCAYFDDVNCNQWQTKCNRCPQKTFADRSRANFILRKDLFSRIHERLTIVPVSNWLGNFVKQSMKNCSIRMIHNGIDTTKFEPKYKKKKVVLGVALPWSPRKGLPDMVKLRQLLPQDIEIKLIGLNDGQLEKLPKGIVGIKRTQNIDELVKHYSEAAVFVNPTYADNFPTTNLEALACGTPVATYRTGGSPEAVDEHTGIVVEKGNVKALAKAIMKILNNPGNFSSDTCRKRAEQCFNKDIQFGKYVDLYESLLSK
ncbi:glycosyltransferase [Parabacteroides sp. ZJ-118]|uniref:glycosyltransferase n=1 Tax=Parabacteroides sp. ZJ-118 TaxID=2709398 RepID=UPI0013EC134D|nr:glycosyltransferase [Parabacteroides sp. ZJ-118]